MWLSVGVQGLPITDIYNSFCVPFSGLVLGLVVSVYQIYNNSSVALLVGFLGCFRVAYCLRLYRAFMRSVVAFSVGLSC